MTRLRHRLSAAARDEGGFSLIELMIVLMILGTVVAAVVTMFTSAMRSEVDLTLRVRAQEQARLALDTLRRDVHCASDTSGITAEVYSTAVTFLLPIGCPSTVTEYVTWCTRPTAEANRFKIHRKSHAVNNPAVDYCAEPGGVDLADHLTEDEAFEYRHEGSERARLNVRLLVDIDPASPSQAYALRDSLVLRNSPR
jgi:prepilin-type N-terminal cleavage/methylation domain-containing protein